MIALVGGLRPRLARALRALATDAQSIEPHQFRRRTIVTGASPLDNDEARQARTEAAMSLMDEELYAYLLIEVRGDPTLGADITLQGHVERECWPGLLMVMDDLCRQVEASLT